MLFGHAGDRSNEDIKRVADAIVTLQPNTYILTELEKYLRGREPGEISDIVEHHLLASGVQASQIQRASSPLVGAQAALKEVNEGDLVLLFALTEREEVRAFIESIK